MEQQVHTLVRLQPAKIDQSRRGVRLWRTRRVPRKRGAVKGNNRDPVRIDAVPAQVIGGTLGYGDHRNAGIEGAEHSLCRPDDRSHRPCRCREHAAPEQVVHEQHCRRRRPSMHAQRQLVQVLDDHVPLAGQLPLEIAEREERKSGAPPYPVDAEPADLFPWERAVPSRREHRDLVPAPRETPEQLMEMDLRTARIWMAEVLEVHDENPHAGLLPGRASPGHKVPCGVARGATIWAAHG